MIQERRATGGQPDPRAWGRWTCAPPWP